MISRTIRSAASYGYARLADVVAADPVRLLVQQPDVFNRLVQEAPGCRRLIEAAVAERMNERRDYVDGCGAA